MATPGHHDHTEGSGHYLKVCAFYIGTATELTKTKSDPTGFCKHGPCIRQDALSKYQGDKIRPPGFRAYGPEIDQGALTSDHQVEFKPLDFVEMLHA